TAPTALPASPTVRSIIKPTDRPTITPIASSTPTLPPTATPDTRLIDLTAPDVNPLTGEKVSDPDVLNRRPLAIKIGDSWEVGVRPQAGASYADWVVEHESEGGIPRWTAIFYGQTPQYVGGTRSCRIIDNEIPAIFKSLLACSGMSGGTREFYLKPSDFNQQHRFFTPDFGDYTPMFYRSDNAPAPHNLMVVPAEIWKEADKRGSNTKPDLSGLTFAGQPLSAGRPTSQVSLKYGSETETWKYDPEATTCGTVKGCWLRWSGGVPHTDALNGQQLSAANVIVVYANHVEDKRYLEEDYGAFKAFGLQIQIWGSGAVRLFRDGQEFGGKWERVNRDDMLTYVDPNGNPIPLKPGKTWLEVVNLGTPLDTK
ncbi:MAG TPA: DUF3048 domain-containing protein, partial [Anaerolineae bacterium]|nr:DUF3048 domain-containing protein [Anaerolineae bacterium]